MTPDVTPLTNGIVLIVLVSAAEKMLGVEAGRIVASMAHVFTFWNWTNPQFISQSMNFESFSIVLQFAVTTILEPTSAPNPTFANHDSRLYESGLRNWNKWSAHYSRGIQQDE